MFHGSINRGEQPNRPVTRSQTREANQENTATQAAMSDIEDGSSNQTTALENAEHPASEAQAQAAARNAAPRRREAGAPQECSDLQLETMKPVVKKARLSPLL